MNRQTDTLRQEMQGRDAERQGLVKALGDLLDQTTPTKERLAAYHQIEEATFKLYALRQEALNLSERLDEIWRDYEAALRDRQAR